MVNLVEQKELKTYVMKAHYGWTAESMSPTDANGNAWQISTSKDSKGVSCTAIQGQMEGEMFSFDMYGAKRLKLFFEIGMCNENKVRSVHASGLKAFAEVMKEQSNAAPEYVVGLGQIIWTDFIHSSENECKRVIYEVTSPGHFKTVSLDGKEFHRDDRVRDYRKKFGIGVYYNEGEMMPMEEVLKLVDAAKVYTEEKLKADNQREHERILHRAALIEKGAKIIDKIPDGIGYVIMAENREDTSDIQSDYHGYSTSDTVYLSWSTHKRDLFAEMRKAAAKFEPTSVYAIAPTPSEEDADNEYWTAPDEHREKYSMGAGYYLGDSKYNGWIVMKSNIDARSIENLQIAAAEGRFFCLETEVEPEKINIEPVEVQAGSISIVEYGDKAIAVIGDTRPIKDKLKSLGGRFNFRLTCGAGWIFPKTKLDEIKASLSAPKLEATADFLTNGNLSFASNAE